MSDMRSILTRGLRIRVLRLRLPHVRLIHVGLIGCGSVLISHPGLALRPRASVFDRRTVSTFAAKDTTDTLSARLATVTTDTGAFAPGRRDFSRYGTPDLCVAAAYAARMDFRRTLSAQEAGDTLVPDTVGLEAVVPLARACGEKFTPANTAAPYLTDLFQLALYEQNDTLAQATLSKLASHASTSNGRDSLWAFGLRSYLEFGRVETAKALVAQVDGQGPATHAAQQALHWQLENFYSAQNPDVATHRQQMIEQELRTVEVAKSLTIDNYVEEARAYRRLIAGVIWTHPDSVSILAAQAQRELSRYKDTPDVINRQVWFPWQTVSLDGAILELAPSWYTYRARGGGVAAPRLHADYWFPAPGHSASDTVRPVAGKINLMCFGSVASNASDDVRMGKLSSSYVLASAIKQWLAQYGADNLEVTFVRKAAGAEHFTYKDWEESRRWFSTPAAEAQVSRWYAQDYEQLPVTVAVQKTQSTWLPAPDGRRVSEAPIQFSAYWQHSPDETTTGVPLDAGKPGACVIVDRDGTIAFSSSIEKYLELGTGLAIEYDAYYEQGVNSWRKDVADALKWTFQEPRTSSTSRRTQGVQP